jgi:methionine-rich copper-binding protein CopC
MSIAMPMVRRASLLAGGLVVALATASASMHVRLVKSEPAKDAVAAAPKRLKLWYSLKPILSLTTVKLTSASDAEVKLGKAAHSGDVKLPVEVSIDARLAPGRYLVSWKTASSDMHPITGEYSFTVR